MDALGAVTTDAQRKHRLAQQRINRRRDGNKHTRNYEKTPGGYLMRKYRNMQSRVTGVQWRKAHLYFGKSLLPREEFYAWAKASPDFWRLYRQYIALGCPRKLAPTVNRINSDLGYEIHNMEWVTHSVNSALANRPSARVMERLYASIK